MGVDPVIMIYVVSHDIDRTKEEVFAKRLRSQGPNYKSRTTKRSPCADTQRVKMSREQNVLLKG